MTFQEDYGRCLRAYCDRALGVNTEGLRDDLYRACLLLSQAGTESQEAANTLLEQAAYGPDLYSGIPAVQLLTDQAGRLTEQARQALERFLLDNSEKWQRELKRGRYDSYRLLAAVPLIGTGVLTQTPALTAAGARGIEEMWEHVQGYDLPDEFLSPFYTALQLSSLALVRVLPVNDTVRSCAARLEDFIWQGVLRHFLPGMLQIAGPFSRGYTTELCGYFQADMAAIYKLLGEEAGFTLTGTLWNEDYAGRVLPHGSLEGMRLYALYFASFPYACAEDTLSQWRERTLPCALTERAYTPPSGNASILLRDEARPALRYPGGDVTIQTRLEDGLAVAWADREYENGMACSSFSLQYRKNGRIKTCFTKLARNEQYIGQWNDYPDLGLRLNECNFPDGGRKTVRERPDGLLVSYRPRDLCQDTSVLRLGFLFPAHFSMPDGVWLDGRQVTRFDGTEYRAVKEIVVEDGGFRFIFRPRQDGGFWRVLLKNRFLNVEWVQKVRFPETVSWDVTFSWERKEADVHAGG